MSTFALRPEFFKAVPVARHKPTRPKPRPRPKPKANLRDTWPDWTAEDRWTAAPRPSDIDLTPFCSPELARPTPAAEAWNLGYALGYDHDAGAVPPAEMPREVMLSWWIGRNTGWLQREADDCRIDRLGECEPAGIRETDIYPPGAVS